MQNEFSMDKSTIDAQIRQNAIKILGLRNPPQLREGTPRVQTTCDDFRRLATTCADLRRLASVDFQNVSIRHFSKMDSSSFREMSGTHI